jgi:hypothetical protein
VTALATPEIVLPRLSWRLTLLFVLMFGTEPAVAQPPPSHLSLPPQSPAPPGKFQARIDAAVRALRENNPRFKDLSPKYVQGLAEFVSGNMLFVLLHEMAHVSIT